MGKDCGTKSRNIQILYKDNIVYQIARSWYNIVSVCAEGWSALETWLLPWSLSCQRWETRNTLKIKASHTGTLHYTCVPMNSQDSGWLQTLPDHRSLFFSPVCNVQLGLVWNWFRKSWPWGQFMLLDRPLKWGQLGQLWPTLLKHGAMLR